jgi:hypothetical protein
VRFLILRCGDPVGHLLLRVFPVAMCASRFRRFVVRDQLGDDA